MENTNLVLLILTDTEQGDREVRGQFLHERSLPVLPSIDTTGGSGGGGGGGGGGSYFLACEDLWRMFDHSFPACAFFFLLFFFFFLKWT